MLILTRAIIERTTPEIIEYKRGLVNLSSNSKIFNERMTPWLATTAKIMIAIATTIPILTYLLVLGGGFLSSDGSLYKINVRCRVGKLMSYQPTN